VEPRLRGHLSIKPSSIAWSTSLPKKLDLLPSPDSSRVVDAKRLVRGLPEQGV
jgi:hypothetical protein